MEIINAMQASSGKRKKNNRMLSITQPLQFLPQKEKDAEWAANNLDWLEWNGIKQIEINSKRLLKNYRLAKGIIDKSDYIVEEDNDMRDLIDTLQDQEETAFELKFYPIIPSVINSFRSIFAKRNSKVVFRAVDDISYNEMAEQKRSQIEDVLFAKAEQRMFMNLINSGLDIGSDDGMQQMQQQMSKENLKTLPEIQSFFDKDYRDISEQWANHQYQVDYERFSMDEIEERAFEDKLITDREFWHFKMYEDDYDIELWNPVTTFYFKSPDTRYISNGFAVGNITLMTPQEVVDNFGYRMTKKQLESLEYIYPIKSAGYNIAGTPNDGSFYDGTRSHADNVENFGLGMRQYTSFLDNHINSSHDVMEEIFNNTESSNMFSGENGMLRVTTSYWKTQLKVGYLTKISENGEVIIDTVSEDYKVTDNPVYDTRFNKNKTKDNLVFGEHIDWIWINQTIGGVKIGPNRPTHYGINNNTEFSPIYLGIDGNEIKPLKYQFKGDNSLYGCKLPVEGAVFNDRNTKSTSIVDMMKPFQIGYNLVNNQISDILIDELGTVILLDQNALPRHSMGETWGKNNLSKAYVAMKDFQMLPLDTTITNTENALNFQHFQKLDLEQTNRLLSRVQLANHFYQQCLQTIGLTPQMLGQQLGQTNTATGVEQAVSGSFTQTEMYFIEHSDYLMPRVHQMRTDLAQYYNSTNPSVRLQYMTSNEENVNFVINGDDLKLRDINVYCTTNANSKMILEQMKNMIVQNNTTGATIYDLGNIMQANSLSEINTVLKASERKIQEQKQQENALQQQLHQEELAARAKEKQMQLDHEALEREKDRRSNILISKIRAAGMAGAVDLNNNQQSDYYDILGKIEDGRQFDEKINIERDKINSEKEKNAVNDNIKRQEILSKQRMKEMDLEIARENQTKAELQAKNKLKNDKKK